MNFDVINFDDITEEELLTAIKKNSDSARELKVSIAELKRIKEEKFERIECLDLEEAFFEDETFETIDKEFEDDVEYFLLELLQKKNATDEEIVSILPKETDPNYMNILLRLKAEFLYKIREVKDYIKDLPREEASIFTGDIATFEQRISVIDELLEMEDEYDETAEMPAEKDNNLIFVPTPTGSLIALEELESIPSEYYPKFLSLFESIKNGTFKNFKRFQSSQASVAGLSEVKDFKVRVMIDRIGPNSYAIISAFTKKTDTSKSYKDLLDTRATQYRNIEPFLKENLSNEEFMKLNQYAEQELFRLLGQPEKTPSVKEKRCHHE